MADTEALRDVLGSRLTLEQLNLEPRLVDNPAIVETIFDPKALLLEAQRPANPRRNPRRGLPTIPAGLGDVVRLEKAEDAPRIQRFRTKPCVGHQARVGIDMNSYRRCLIGMSQFWL